MGLQLHWPGRAAEMEFLPPLEDSPGSPFGLEAHVELPVSVDSILFCAEDLLYDATEWWRWVVQLLERLGVETNFRCLHTVWCRDYLDEVHRGRLRYWAAYRQLLRSLGLTPAQAAEVIAATRPRYRESERQLRFLPGVPRALQELSAAGLPMAVLSSLPWPATRVERLLIRLGLRAWIGDVWSAWDLRAAVVDCELYEKLVRQLGWQGGRVALVGHDTRQMAAGAAAGMLPIGCAHRSLPSVAIRIGHIGHLARLIEPAPRVRQAG